MIARGALGALSCMLAAGVALGAAGCAPGAERAAAPQTPVPARSAVVSAAKPANRLDVAQAKAVALQFVDALASRDATAAAGLMTAYRRDEPRAKGWKREVGWWRAARIQATVAPGHYINDERAFVQLYAEHFGHAPYQLVVVNVRYGLGPGEPPGDTDFVITRDNAGAPWLVHDFGGALRPSSVPTSSP